MNDEFFTPTAPTNSLELTTLKSKSSKSNKRKTINDDDNSNNQTEQQQCSRSLDLLEDSSVYLQRPQKKWRYMQPAFSKFVPSLLFLNDAQTLESPPTPPQTQQQQTEDRFMRALDEIEKLRDQTERETRIEREWETVHIHEVQSTTSTSTTRKDSNNEKCIQPDCLKTQVYTSSGFCRMHYAEQRRREREAGIENNLKTVYSEETKEELLALVTMKPCLQTILMGDNCSASDCEGTMYCRNLCRKHYTVANRYLRKQKMLSNNEKDSE